MSQLVLPKPLYFCSLIALFDRTLIETGLQEENRLRAKARRDQAEAAQGAGGTTPAVHRTASGFVATEDVHVVGDASAGRKRPLSSVSREELPATNRDARSPAKPGAPGEGSEIRPARNFAKYVDYNFSAMTDTKGGFLSAEDDPWNKAFAAPDGRGGGAAGPSQAEERPKHMTAAEWERLQLIRNLKRQKSGPYEPGLSALTEPEKRKKCSECGSLEIDWVWEEVFGVSVCGACKEKFPDKYSLLTKTECREDYLLTDREFRLLSFPSLVCRGILGSFLAETSCCSRAQGR